MVSQVQEKRPQSGKRLMPSSLGARLRKEKAEKAREEAERADKEEGSKRTISFGGGSSNTKTVTPMKSALRKGPKETVKVFKHDLVVDVRVRVNYTNKKNKVRKQVCNCLGEAWTSSGRRSWKARWKWFSSAKKEGNPKNPIKTTSDFSSTAFVLTKDYAFVSNLYAFSDGRNTSKTVDLCMVMGMDVEIEQLLEEWRMNLSERGIEIREKPGQRPHM